MCLSLTGLTAPRKLPLLHDGHAKAVAMFPMSLLVTLLYCMCI